MRLPRPRLLSFAIHRGGMINPLNPSKDVYVVKSIQVNEINERILTNFIENKCPAMRGRGEQKGAERACRDVHFGKAFGDARASLLLRRTEPR